MRKAYEKFAAKQQEKKGKAELKTRGRKKNSLNAPNESKIS